MTTTPTPTRRTTSRCAREVPPMTCDCPTVTETELGRHITYTQHGLNCTNKEKP